MWQKQEWSKCQENQGSYARTVFITLCLGGINHQCIFEDTEDYLKFLEVMKNYKEICEYKVFAYCLMENHVHLLLKVGKEDLSKIFKRIGGSYVYWYNWKYQRAGHLF